MIVEESRLMGTDEFELWFISFVSVTVDITIPEGGSM